MDEGKGGLTRSLQEREGENRKQSANLGRNEKEKKKRDQPGQGDSGQEGHGKGLLERGKGGGWAGQKAHDGGLGDGLAVVAEASRALSEAVVAVLSASRGSISGSKPC